MHIQNICFDMLQTISSDISSLIWTETDCMHKSFKKMYI